MRATMILLHLQRHMSSNFAKPSVSDTLCSPTAGSSRRYGLQRTDRGSADRRMRILSDLSAKLQLGRSRRRAKAAYAGRAPHRGISAPYREERRSLCNGAYSTPLKGKAEAVSSGFHGGG